MIKRKNKGLRNPAKHKARLIRYIESERPGSYALLYCWPGFLCIASAVSFIAYFHLFNQKPNGQEINFLNYIHIFSSTISLFSASVGWVITHQILEL